MTPRKKNVKRPAKKAVKRKSGKKKPAKKVVKRPKNVTKKRTKKKAVKKLGKKKPDKKVPKKVVRKKPQKKLDIPSFAKKESERKQVSHPVLPWTNNPRIDMVVRVLKELTRTKTLSDWRINFVHKRSANMYIGNRFKIEDRLAALREDLTVTIYKRFPNETIGEAQLPIIATAESIIRKEIEEAATICEHARKKSYTLPTPEQVEFPTGFDTSMIETFETGDGLTIPLKIHKEMKTILTEQDVKTNCYEILSAATGVRVINSNNVDVSFHQTGVYIEVTMSAKADGDEQEHHWYTRAVSPDQIDLHSVLEQQAGITKDAARAEQSAGFTGDVLLSGRSLLDFFAPEDSVNPLILHTFAKLKMMGISQLSLGEQIGEFEGEPFTISSNPQLALGTLTVPVDEEGTPLKPVDLIRTGVFVNHIATARYAQHLDLPHTGMVSNIHVSDGATREEHLRGHNYVEIVSFSWFNPDPFSGEFSAEIRLGYKWERGRKTPFKGGHFIGNVFKNILKARFSKEIMQENHYYGPRAILFKNATVTKRGG